MTDHTDVPIVATGDWIDAAFINQYWGDNFRAIFQGFANPGSIPYALDANTIAELVKPSVNAVLSNNSSGVLAWLAQTAIPGRIHTSGAVDKNTTFNTASLSWVDVTGANFNLTLTSTCTIYVLAFGAFGMNSFSKTPRFGVSVNAVDETLEVDQEYYDLRGTFFTARRVTGVAAGTRAIQLRAKMSAAGDDVTVYQARVIAFAVVD